jgi:2-amino-4-hydroxy-6-hydroxymethyldihydropteridine diphosphokinase
MNAGSGFVVIAAGANVRGRRGTPEQTLRWAIGDALPRAGIEVLAVSAPWSCAPFGPVPQPRFLNAVLLCRTRLAPACLASALRKVENAAGRRRGRPWGPRALDLDILDMSGHLRRPWGMGRRARGLAARAWQQKGLILPHPGIAERAFVLLPLQQVLPCWRHPLTGRTPAQMLHALPPRHRRSCRAAAEVRLPGAVPAGREPFPQGSPF